jgi:hypothetical protein
MIGTKLQRTQEKNPGSSFADGSFLLTRMGRGIHEFPPCPTLLRPAGGWPAAVFYPLDNPRRTGLVSY